jgi:hypothetical protein
MRTGKRSTEIIGDTPFRLRHSPAVGWWHLLENGTYCGPQTKEGRWRS